ncbi:MAG: 4Fe-4S dicluster domain-containing protein [Euryarchaeota archaeon]|nr:4Fe-4S dicluster domain-containing protein [Euryarchaeota archaeon]
MGLIPPILWQCLKQMFKRPFTNLFPAKYTPKSVIEYLERVRRKEVSINPPIAVPENFRGKIGFDVERAREKCTGCGLCARVCPAGAFSIDKEEKRVRIWISRCVFCSQCVDACPAGLLRMTDEFLLAGFDRDAKELIVELRFS